MRKKTDTVNPYSKYRSKLVRGYAKSPELLAVRLSDIFRQLTDQTEVHNSAVHEIESIVGTGRMPILFEQIAKSIITLSSGEANAKKEEVSSN